MGRAEQVKDGAEMAQRMGQGRRVSDARVSSGDEQSNPSGGWISPEFPGMVSSLIIQAGMKIRAVRDAFATPSFNMWDTIRRPSQLLM